MKKVTRRSWLAGSLVFLGSCAFRRSHDAVLASAVKEAADEQKPTIIDDQACADDDVQAWVTQTLFDADGRVIHERMYPLRAQTPAES